MSHDPPQNSEDWLLIHLRELSVEEVSLQPEPEPEDRTAASTSAQSPDSVPQPAASTPSASSSVPAPVPKEQPKAKAKSRLPPAYRSSARARASAAGFVSSEREELAKAAGESAALWLSGSWGASVPKPADSGSSRYYVVLRDREGSTLNSIFHSWADCKAVVAYGDSIAALSVFRGFESEFEAAIYISASQQ